MRKARGTRRLWREVVIRAVSGSDKAFEGGARADRTGGCAPRAHFERVHSSGGVAVGGGRSWQGHAGERTGRPRGVWFRGRRAAGGCWLSTRSRVSIGWTASWVTRSSKRCGRACPTARKPQSSARLAARPLRSRTPVAIRRFLTISSGAETYRASRKRVAPGKNGHRTGKSSAAPPSFCEERRNGSGDTFQRVHKSWHIGSGWKSHLDSPPSDALGSPAWCEKCGCTSEMAHGWVAFLSRDPDDPNDPPIVVSYRPPCGFREFSIQGTAAATYT
jgi:hypothetical protein